MINLWCCDIVRQMQILSFHLVMGFWSWTLFVPKICLPRTGLASFVHVCSLLYITCIFLVSSLQCY